MSNRRPDEGRIRDGASVAVVGGAGFLGSHCVDLLVERGCRVLVIDNLCAGRREFVHPKAAFFHADITSSEHCLATVFLQHEVEWVFNHAAWPYVPTSFERPVHVCNVNFMGALHVINAAQEAEAKGILQVSSAEIYGGRIDQDGRPEGNVIDVDDCVSKLTEKAFVYPHSSYGASKAAVDAYVQVAWRERRTPCIALRQFNCLGKRDCLHPYVVPAIIEQLEKPVPFNHSGCTVPTCANINCQLHPQERVIKLGNNSFRDFLDAEDQARMAVELLERGRWGECYNLGSESGVKMYDLARLVGEVMGFAEVRVERDEARVRPWEIWHLCSDNSKIYGVIEARPQVPLEESLRRMVAWYKEHR